MKRISLGLMIVLLLLTSCSPKNEEQELVQDGEENNEQKSIVPSYQLTDEEYKVVLPFRPSKARGVINDRIENRMDISEMESGLKRHSTEMFDPKTHFFEEGQYLTSDIIKEWSGRKNKTEVKGTEVEVKGLNPEISVDSEYDASVKELKDNPRYISHILEQNYLVHDDNKSVELGGVSIGIAMKSVYRFQTEIGGPYEYREISKKEMEKQAKDYAETIVSRMREVEGLENVPILIAVYREEEQDSAVPGNYVMKTTVDQGETEIKKWEDINEQYVLFPSSEAKKNFVDDHQIITSFGDDIAEFFPNYVGIIGEGFYANKELQTLKIEIPIDFYGQSEVVGFTQYVYGLIQEKFPDHYDLQVEITSTEGTESVLIRNKGEEEPFVHIMY